MFCYKCKTLVWIDSMRGHHVKKILKSDNTKIQCVICDTDAMVSHFRPTMYCTNTERFHKEGHPLNGMNIVARSSLEYEEIMIFIEGSDNNIEYYLE